MRRPISFWTLALLAAVLPVAADAAAAQDIRAGGTGTATEMLRQVGAAFSAASGVKVQVVPSLGSNGALRALKEGALDIAVSARPPKSDEAAAGLKQIAVMRTAFVLATSQAKPNGFKMADLPGILSSTAPAWADGTPIRIILRPRSESDTALMGAMYDGMPKAIEALRARTEVPVAATDQDNANMAERIPGSLTGTTMAQLKAEKRNLRIVPLNEVEPTLVNLETGAYPFWKKLYVVVRENGSPDATLFTDFLRSPQGEKALRELEILAWTE